MNDRAFRLDFYLAMGALVVSILTTATLIYQTRVIQQQYSATIWPYLSLTATYSPQSVKLQVSNEGLGPALIQSAQLSVDGKNVAAWSGYIQAMSRDPAIRSVFLRVRAEVLARRASGIIMTGSIGPGSTIRPGTDKTLLNMDLPYDLPDQAWSKHAITLDFCYCSLNGSCWNLHAAPGQNRNAQPQPTSHCVDSASILASTVKGKP